MFDLSWIELAFVAALALIVIGPKDLPEVLEKVGKLIARMRRMYRELLGQVQQLQREIDLSEGKGSVTQDWKNWLPDDVRHLPDDFIPGSMSESQHKARAEKLAQSKRCELTRHGENTNPTPNTESTSSNDQ